MIRITSIAGLVGAIALSLGAASANAATYHPGASHHAHHGRAVVATGPVHVTPSLAQPVHYYRHHHRHHAPRYMVHRRWH